jgi:hypothetical protein
VVLERNKAQALYVGSLLSIIPGFILYQRRKKKERRNAGSTAVTHQIQNSPNMKASLLPPYGRYSNGLIHISPTNQQDLPKWSVSVLTTAGACRIPVALPAAIV